MTKAPGAGWTQKGRGAWEGGVPHAEERGCFKEEEAAHVQRPWETRNAEAGQRLLGSVARKWVRSQGRAASVGG